ncbi:hypothetical protein EJ03DRAFT_327435 [Teratosphaeria nubilosa]|uniref:Uncharacterized protein n=1 Tax=Teratosphaeria nubilosa TaxID=161662 RepID=A0A6G1LAD2_9PEZI|nr:hypothetical protein EJ03DRAFT_327435 [Teratosphaeria nubilosa]
MTSQQSNPDDATPTASAADTGSNQEPYTLVRSASGNHLQVQFISGSLQGHNFKINVPEVQARTDRDNRQGRNQASVPDRYEYREEDSPQTSCHDADGRLITEEEYEILAARELAEEQERHQRNAGAQRGTGRGDRRRGTWSTFSAGLDLLLTSCQCGNCHPGAKEAGFADNVWFALVARFSKRHHSLKPVFVTSSFKCPSRR